MANKYYNKYSKEEIANAVKNSTSWRQVINYLAKSTHKLNYRGSESHIKKRAITFGIDFSHFPGIGWSKGKTFSKKSIEFYLQNKQYISSNKLKYRLLNENYKKYECEACKKNKWMNSKIPLELHHIDHNPKNNNLNNIKLLCPNCHYLEHNNPAYSNGREDRLRSGTV